MLETVPKTMEEEKLQMNNALNSIGYSKEMGSKIVLFSTSLSPTEKFSLRLNKLDEIICGIFDTNSNLF